MRARRQTASVARTGIRRVAFTLFEILVSLAIISLLISIALVSLKQVRRQSVHVGAAAGIRQAHLALSLYMADNNQRLPFMGTPGDPAAPIEINGIQLPNGNTGGVLFFQRNSRFWASLLRGYWSANPVMDDVPMLFDHSDQYGAAPGTLVSCRYRMTYTAFADPKFWTEPEGWKDLSLIRGTRLTQIKQPARKGLLLDLWSNIYSPVPAWKTDKVLVAFGDGSVRQEYHQQQAPAVTPPYFFDITPAPIMQTEHGLAGIDY